MSTIVRNTADGAVIAENALSHEDFHCPDVHEERFSLQHPLGDTRFDNWCFDGIRIAYSDTTFHAPQVLEWKDDLDVVHLHFNLEGRMHVRPQSMKRTFAIDSNVHNIMYCPGFHAEMQYHDRRHTVFVVQFTRETFLRLAEHSTDKLQRFSDAFLSAGEPVMLSERNAAVDIPLQRAIDDIRHCRFEGGLKKMFLYSKCLEILVHQAEAFDREERRVLRYCRTEQDRERILYAREYLEKHCADPPTLPELARIVGVNEFKLKNGFRELFGTTVFGYLTDYRMELAQHALLDERRTVGEVAYALGYSSPQHFSSAFKKKFGCPPGDVVRKGK